MFVAKTLSLFEKRCCAFWGFEVHQDGNELMLSWDGSLTAFSGLL